MQVGAWGIGVSGVNDSLVGSSEKCGRQKLSRQKRKLRFKRGRKNDTGERDKEA